VNLEISREGDIVSRIGTTIILYDDVSDSCKTNIIGSTSIDAAHIFHAACTSDNVRIAAAIKLTLDRLVVDLSTSSSSLQRSDKATKVEGTTRLQKVKKQKRKRQA
jgi:hypothetical protein